MKTTTALFSDRPRRQAGMTLIELMVALALGLLVVGAAVATLLIGRQGFTTVDSTTQLRESARFAASLIERAAVESGFENAAYQSITIPKSPGLRGYDNAVVSALTGLPGNLAHDTRTTSSYCTGATGTTCANGSDVLVVRFWGSSVGVASGGDGSMVNCAGISEPEGTGTDPRAYSIFHVVTGASGEPVLACTYRDASGAFKTVPLVQGVEGFQVRYGTMGVTPGACSAAVVYSDAALEDRFLTAKQLDGPGNAYCDTNWQRVRSIRIGLLVRGPVGSAQTRTAATWNVLAAPNATYTFPSPASPTDTGAVLSTAADGRLRQQLVFTIHLRNAQYSP